MSVLGLIPCRGGSKGIRRKNVKPVGGKPLLAHTVDASHEADRIDRTIVSTDDAEIKETALEAGADVPFDRPAELATDEAPMEPVVKHAVEWLHEHEDETYDTIALLQATSPLRTAKQIDEAIEQYESADASSLVAVSEGDSYRWRETPHGAEIVNYERRQRRQDKQSEYIESGALYLVDTDLFLETGDLQAGQTTLFVLDQVSALDIDDPFELWLADKVLSAWRR
jgi:N-acylneuraminate cytidylyltransferase/CMP-N,N'-diacetyllegionaminic acid synthase